MRFIGPHNIIEREREGKKEGNSQLVIVRVVESYWLWQKRNDVSVVKLAIMR
jgi:hypothetical protein